MNDAEIAAFLRRHLEGPRFLECALHLAECDTCREKLAREQDLGAMKVGFETYLSPFAEHIPENEIGSYVSGRLGPTRMREMDGHLKKCAQCAGEVRDLRKFTGSLRSDRAFLFLPRKFMARATIAAAALAVAILAFIAFRRPSEVVSLIDTSGRISLDSHGAVRGDGKLDRDQQNAVRQALAQQKLSFPDALRSLHGEGGTLMGAAESIPFRLESPIATVVQSSRPTLSWTSDSESMAYIVTVKDQNSGEVVKSSLLKTTYWTVPTDLERSHTYIWQVVSSRKHGEEVIAPPPLAPAAKFIVLDESTNSKLQHLPPSHLVRAVLYADAGLLDDANRELTMLQNANPKSSLVRNLSDQLRQARSSE
jgi:hypothetical protein